MHDPDVVVIGSGPAGAMAAMTLVERGVDVLMLDAGDHVPGGLIVRAAGNTVYRRMAWADYASDRLDPGSAAGVDWYSSLSLGGLSNYWTAAVPRFAPQDFVEGAQLDERYRWPVTYEDLEPFYVAAERQLGVTAGAPILRLPPNERRYEYRLPKDWQQIADATERHGHGVGAMPLAKGRPWMVARRGTEFNSYHCVISPLVASPSFRLIAGAHVVKLNWSGRAGRVDSVEYVDRGTGARRTVHARAIVVAAGAIDSTVLLLRSRSHDFPTGLGNSRDLLGRYLHDHPRQWWVAESRRPLRAPAHPVYITRDPYDGGQPLMATSLTIGLSQQLQRLRTYYRGSTRTVGVQVFGTMVPSSETRVTIDRDIDDDHDVRPTITLHYEDAAIANVMGARDRLREVMACASIDAKALEPSHELRPGSSVHYGGSVRMHADPALGMLDPWNRLHEVPNVAVVDSSCFTTGPEKNPTLTAMAIAIRAADRLGRDLRDDTV